MAHEEAPGRYLADVAVAAENAQTIYRTLELAFTGDWSDTVDDMAATNLRVTVGRGAPR